MTEICCNIKYKMQPLGVTVSFFKISKYHTLNLQFSNDVLTPMSFVHVMFTDMTIVRTVVAVVGKGFSSASFATLVLYSSELYPTVVRQV